MRHCNKYLCQFDVFGHNKLLIDRQCSCFKSVNDISDHILKCLWVHFVSITVFDLYGQVHVLRSSASYLSWKCRPFISSKVFSISKCRKVANFSKRQSWPVNHGKLRNFRCFDWSAFFDAFSNFKHSDWKEECLLETHLCLNIIFNSKTYILLLHQRV